jgi:hypothetical protein
LRSSSASGSTKATRPVDGEEYRSTFYDSFGNVHRSRIEIDGGVNWAASMDVTLRKAG